MFQLILSIGSAFLEILFLDEAVLGWPSLQFVLQKEGYFGYLCQNNASNYMKTNLSSTNPPEIDCSGQEASFNLVYTLWLSALFLCSFPVGWKLQSRIHVMAFSFISLFISSWLVV